MDDLVTSESDQRLSAPWWRRLLGGASARGVLVFVVGLLIRVWVGRSGPGRINSDEAFTSLMAGEVLKGHFPIIYPGLVYTAVLDSYLMAPVVAIFGQTIWIVKLFPSVYWGPAALLLAATVRSLVGRREGFLAGSLLWLAPGALAVLSARSWESYPSGMFFTVATLYAVVRLMDTAEDSPRQPQRWRSVVAGALAGFTFYLHPMFLVVLIPLLLVPSWTYRTRAKTWWLPALGAAFLVNVPFLAWNIKNSYPSLNQPAVAIEGPAPRFVRFFTGLLPRAFGLRRFNGDWMFGKPISVFILVILAVLGLLGIWKLVRHNRARCLLLLLPAMLAWPMMAQLTNMTFVTDGRYVISTFPFIVSMLAIGLGSLWTRRDYWLAAFLAAWVGLLIAPFMYRQGGNSLRDPNADYRQIAAYLQSRGIDRVAGYYWQIFPVEFVSNRAILTGVAGHPPIVTLPWTQRIVESTPDERLVFIRPDHDLVDTFRLPRPVDMYNVVEIAGAVLYIPKEIT